MATGEPAKSSEAGTPADDMEAEISLEVKTLKEKVAKLTADNTRLKNELRFTMQHQKRMSDENVESLQNDVDVLTARNNKLSSDLMRTEADLQTARHTKAQLDADYSANVTSQATALVEQLTKAQQEHEKKIQAELSEALTWRERIITKMQDMDIQDIFEDDFEEQRDSSYPMEERLQSLVESLRSEKSALTMQKTGVLIVEEIRRKREGNQKKIQELVDFLRQEIEAANSKKLALENDVTRLRRKIEMVEMEFKLVDKQRVKTLQSQLKAAITEKDEWKKKANKFEDTLETLKIINSLQKSLSKDEDIKRKYEKEFHRSQAEKVALTNQLEAALQDRNRCVRERNEVIQERNSLALQVQQEYERAERLHRLVVVLRKKAHNSAGSTRSPPASYEL